MIKQFIAILKTVKLYIIINHQKKSRTRHTFREHFDFIRQYFWIKKNWGKESKDFNIFFMYPCLGEKTASTSIDPHYFYQSIWAFKRIKQANPVSHIDIGSWGIFVGFLSTITNVEFLDIRPLEVSMDNMSVKMGSLIDLPYPDNSVSSISCLHVAEHVGLGRYGDPMDLMGTVKSCKELQRVLKPGGKLYFSLPVAAKNRIEFNAHRVHTIDTILKYFSELKLIELSAVKAGGKYLEHLAPSDFNESKYDCGLFIFTK